MAKVECGFSKNPNGQQLLTTWGPTLNVDIGFDPTFTPGPVPVPGIRAVSALVDTGATECCIDNLLATQLNLPIVDRRRISGSGGQHEVNVYLAQIHVPALPYTIYGAFCGVDLAAGGQIHKALMGRTFLQNFVMFYEGHTGRVVISSPHPAAPPVVIPAIAP